MSLQVEQYGLVAEFKELEQIVEATRRVWQQGYRQVDAYSPFPSEELSEAIGFTRTRIPLIVLIGGVVGAAGGYLLQYWISAVDYPLNVGGRPYHSWPAFVPVTFELGILVAALSALLGMLARNGLPLPYHPLFNVDAFSRATEDRFFLCIESRDAKFHPEETRQLLEQLGAVAVYDVPQ